MDAYDIFRKLSKGLKFKTNIVGLKFKQKPHALKDEALKSENAIKQEELSSTEDYGSEAELTGPTGDCSSSESQSEHSTEKLDANGQPTKIRNKNKDKPESSKQKQEIEEQNRFRKSFGIRAVGRAIPPALADFSSAATLYGVSTQLLDTVRQCGYTEPTPVQRQALPCMLLKRQILATAPTGSGKTAAFLVPVVHTLTTSGASGAPRALVLCPTRELAKQTYREAVRLTAGTALRCSVVNKVTDAKLKERESTFNKSDIVITTPNRLCFLLNHEDINVKLDKVVWLVVDEADKLFEGSETQESDFRQQMEVVLEACAGRERRVAMFSATHTPAVARWCRRNLRGLITITIGKRNVTTSLVEQELLYCGNEAGKLLAFRQLVQKGLKPPVLVFVQSKERAKQLFKELIYDGINVDVIHADRTQAQRDNVVRSFRLGRIWVLICTELLGRGIDFCGVSLVVNYDLPPSPLAYIHRIGRAGRAGVPGRAVTFFTQDDAKHLRSIAAVMQQSGCQVPEYMLKLPSRPSERQKLRKHAPARDDISTILPSKNKRKLETEPSEKANADSFKRHKQNNTPGKHVKLPTSDDASKSKQGKENKFKKNATKEQRKNIRKKNKLEKNAGSKNKQKKNRLKVKKVAKIE